MKRVRENPLFLCGICPPPSRNRLFIAGGQETAVSGVCSGPGFAFPAGAWVCPKVDVEVVPNARVVAAAEARGVCPAYAGTGYSRPGVPAMLLRMRASPLRVSGVVPIRASNSASSIASHASASIASGSNTGSKAGLVCIGAFWLWGQQLWQRSQPKIQPSRPIPSAGSFSIVWQEIQRPVSITFGATMAPVGQLSMQLWQRPQRDPSNGGS